MFAIFVFLPFVESLATAEVGPASVEDSARFRLCRNNINVDQPLCTIFDENDTLFPQEAPGDVDGIFNNLLPVSRQSTVR